MVKVEAPKYDKPRIVTYGSLLDLTRNDGMFGTSPLAQAGMTLSPLMMPGGPPPQVAGELAVSPPPEVGVGPPPEVAAGPPPQVAGEVVDSPLPGAPGEVPGDGGGAPLPGAPGEVPGDGGGAQPGGDAASPAGPSGGAPVAAAGDTDTGDQPAGELPFSGFAAGAVSAVGGVLTAAGVALRRATRRG